VNWIHVSLEKNDASRHGFYIKKPRKRDLLKAFITLVRRVA
jgi:hypothetical protein